MKNITLYISDHDTALTYERILSDITLSVDEAWTLEMTHALIGPHGMVNCQTTSLPLEAYRLNALEEKLREVLPDYDPRSLLLNAPLIELFVSAGKDLPSINEAFQKVLMEDYHQCTDEEDQISLAVEYQAYGHFLSVYDPPSAIDAYSREKDLLEEVAENDPREDNISNYFVGLEDLAEAYDQLGDDFREETLHLYLTLYHERSKHEENTYELGHICEKIGILYSLIDTLEDVDDIDLEDEKLKLSIAYHQKERSIFAGLDRESPSAKTAYNYGISLRQLGKRYEALATPDDLKTAQKYYEETCTIMKALYEKDDSYRDSYIISLEHLGDCASLQADHQRALAYYLEVEKEEQHDLDEDPTTDNIFAVAIIKKKIGRIYHRLKDKNAIHYFQDAFKLTSSLQSLDDYEHVSELGICYMNIGWYYFDYGDFAKADDYFRRDFTLRQQLYDRYQSISAHYSLSLALRHLGYVTETRGDLNSALSYYEKVLRIASLYRNQYSKTGTHYLNVSKHDYASCLMKLGRIEEAKPLYEELLDSITRNQDTKPHEYPLDASAIKEEYEQLKGLSNH